MSIFAMPQSDISDGDIKVLFLHGLAGSPDGAKATHLRAEWKARSPVLRTRELLDLSKRDNRLSLRGASREELDSAMEPAYEDACAAVRYFDPDIVVGSSLGGALLAKMVMEDKWNGNCVFLAPAIDSLLGDVTLPEMRSAVWILGECDDITPNIFNIRHCRASSGQLMVSRDDNHQLEKALAGGLIDSAITTSLEISCAEK